jgi:hypothetical protein
MNPEEQTSAKRQAYSFNFPPDKKEKFAALARSMNRPMAWLLLEAIDRMIESGGAYPSNTPTANPSDDVLGAYVSKSGMSEALKGYIQADEARAIADSTIEQALVPIRERLSLIERAGNPSQKAKPSPAKGPQPSASENEVQKWAKRCEAEPLLRAAIEEGLGQDLIGKALTEFVFSKGFGAVGNTKPFDASVAARMRGAIEYLNNINNGDSNV